MNDSRKQTWRKEDYILTLNLFFELLQQKSTFSKDNERVIEIARNLNRTPNAVVMRLQNYVYCYREIDPEGADKLGLGNGLKNGGKECMFMLQNYINDNHLNHTLKADASTETIDAQILNRIVIKLAFKSMNEDFDSDGKVYNALLIILNNVNNETFTLSQLSEISAAVHFLYTGNTELKKLIEVNLMEIVESVLKKKLADRMEKLIAVFLPKNHQVMINA